MLTNTDGFPKRVAIIHDWLNTYRGGERVLEAFCELFPDADLFTLFHSPGKSGKTIESHKINVSFLNRLPGSDRYYRHLLPLLPLAIERFDLTGYDLVISSSHCVAKGVIPAPDALHLCYCHTPMRYAWDRYSDYFKGIKEALILPFIHYLRMWDVTSSARVDHFLANSAWTGNRIQRYYRREFDVLHPFVDLDFFQPSFKEKTGEGYYLVVSAFAPYKRIDLAIDACEKLGRRLLIVGEGQDQDTLRKKASSRIEFLGRRGKEELLPLYQGARALLFPGEEDFGITPLEAMACGTPVIALGRGGVTETVVSGETGLFFPESTVDSLAEAILDFEKMPTGFSLQKCRDRAALFSKEAFRLQFRKWLEKYQGGKSRPSEKGQPLTFSPQSH